MDYPGANGPNTMEGDLKEVYPSKKKFRKIKKLIEK